MNFIGVDGEQLILRAGQRRIVQLCSRFAEGVAEGLHRLEIALFRAAGDIVDFARLAVEQNPVDSPAVIFHKSPVPNVLRRPRRGNVLIVQRVNDRLGDQGVGRLGRPVIGRAPRNRHGNGLFAPAGEDEGIRRRLGRRVDRRWLRPFGFVNLVIVAEGNSPVDVRRRDLMKPRHTAVHTGHQQPHRAGHIGLKAKVGPATFPPGRREIDDHVGLFYFEDTLDRQLIGDIRFNEGEIRRFEGFAEISDIAAMLQRVNADQRIPRVMLAPIMNKITAHKAGPAGCNDFHVSVPPVRNREAHKARVFNLI